MKMQCLITGLIYPVELLTEEKFKKDHPIWGSWDTEKCLRYLGRPKLFEGERYCIRYVGGLVTIAPKYLEYYCPLV